MIKIFFIPLLLLASFGVTAQSITVQSLLYKLDRFSAPDDLLKISLLSDFPNLKFIDITIEMREKNGSSILTMKAGPYQIKNGINILHSPETTPVLIWGSCLAAQQYMNAHTLPSGDYSIFYKLIDQNNKENISIYSNENLSVIDQNPPHLVFPFDQAEISTLTPKLKWSPPVPNSPDITYSLKLVEIQNGNDKYSAINNNAPIISAKEISGFNMNYPEGIENLKYEHTYAWQVFAFIGNYNIGNTEVWQFTPTQNSPEEKKKKETLEDNDSYWILGNQLDGGNLNVFQNLKISFNNLQGDTILNYEIKSLNNPGSTITNLPILKLKHGLNLLSVDLENYPDLFIKGDEYICQIHLRDERNFVLRFKYYGQ